MHRERDYDPTAALVDFGPDYVPSLWSMCLPLLRRLGRRESICKDLFPKRGEEKKMTSKKNKQTESVRKHQAVDQAEKYIWLN